MVCNKIFSEYFFLLCKYALASFVLSCFFGLSFFAKRKNNIFFNFNIYIEYCYYYWILFSSFFMTFSSPFQYTYQILYNIQIHPINYIYSVVTNIKFCCRMMWILTQSQYNSVVIAINSCVIPCELLQKMKRALTVFLLLLSILLANTIIRLKWIAAKYIYIHIAKE